MASACPSNNALSTVSLAGHKQYRTQQRRRMADATLNQPQETKKRRDYEGRMEEEGAAESANVEESVNNGGDDMDVGHTITSKKARKVSIARAQGRQ